MYVLASWYIVFLPPGTIEWKAYIYARPGTVKVERALRSGPTLIYYDQVVSLLIHIVARLLHH